MRKAIALGLGLLFLGSCGVTPQLTIKSRRYQKGLFVQISTKHKNKHKSIKHGHPTYLSSIPSYKTNDRIPSWWELSTQGSALRSSSILYSTEAYSSESHSTTNTPIINPGNSHFNTIGNHLATPSHTLNKKQIKREIKQVKKLLNPAPAPDSDLSLWALITAISGYVFLFLGGVLPFLGLLSLLAFIAGLVLSIVSISKYGSDAKSIIALVLSALGCLMWLVFAFIIGAAFAVWLGIASAAASGV